MSAISRLFKSPNRSWTNTGKVPPGENILVNFKNITQGYENVNPLGMAYWPNIQNIPARSYIHLLTSINDKLVIFKLDKQTLEIIGLISTYIPHTGEGCFWSVEEDVLFIPTNKSLDIFNIKYLQQVTLFVDPKYNIWQVHCDARERVFSYTCKDENYNEVKWGIYDTLAGFSYFDIKGKPDECQIDKSAKYLLAKETYESGEGNRIINLESKLEQIITDAQGALGHSDMGFECMLGEDDKTGMLTLWDLQLTKRIAISNVNQWNMGYVSYCHAKDEDQAKQFAIVSGGNNHRIYKVPLDNSILSDLYNDQGSNLSHLSKDEQYKYRPKANIDKQGEFICWSAYSNSRLDVYVARVP